jgi:hypothetical protein
MLTKLVAAERWWDLCWNIMVWFMGISYLENFLTWQYGLIGGWFDKQYIWYGAWEAILILLILVLQKTLHWVSWQHYVLQRFALGWHETTIYCIELPHCISSTRGERTNSDIRTCVTSVCISEWK